MNLVGYIEGAASSMSNGNLACLVGFEIPRDVWIFRVLL